jgi:hypothetical protein
LVAGLVSVRWLSTMTAPPVARATAARAPVSEVPTEPLPRVTEPELTAATVDNSELVSAHDDAIRQALEALEDDDITTARSFYLLARAAQPDDDEVQNRLREVEIVLLIDGRRNGWTEVLGDLADLRDVAPSSPTILRAYVAGLVGAGREALADREFRRAGDLCGEAYRWFPDRADARQCLLQSGFFPTATPLPPPTARPTSPPLQPTLILPGVATSSAASEATSPPLAPANPTEALVPTDAPLPATPVSPVLVLPSPIPLLPTVVPTSGPANFLITPTR